MRSPLLGMARLRGRKPSTRRILQIEQLEERLLLASLPVAPLEFGSDPRINPDDFRVTLFATGLNYPVSMQELSDGSFLVGTANPTSKEAGFFNATVELVRLVDADDDGVADDPGQVVFSGLLGAVTSVREAGDLLFVASTNFSGPERQISVLCSGESPGDPYTLIGNIVFAPRDGSIHETKTLAIRETPGQSESYDLVFGVGSITNATATTAPVDVSGLITATINADSIYLVTVDNTGSTPAFSGLTQIAAGVRNTAGIIFSPTTGDLYFADNSFNEEHTDDGHSEPVHADELNVLAAADIGGETEHYGFPFDYIEYGTGTRVGSGAVQPIAAFQPISTTDPVVESKGPSEIAFSPSEFPTGLDNGVFVTFYGSGSSGTANRSNPVVYVDLDTGEYFHFITVESAGVGHIAGVLSTQDSLFLADLSSTGDFRNATGAGMIYQILSLPVLEEDTVGLYNPVTGTFYLKGENSPGNADLIFDFGPKDVGWSPLAGDWDGDGNSGVGLFDPERSYFFLQNTLAPGGADVGFRYGPSGLGWKPIVGDWDADVDDSVGLYDPVAGKFFLDYGNGSGYANLVYRFGPANVDWTPVAGDWDGDGYTTVGLYDASRGIFFLNNFHEPGEADMMYRYGPAGNDWTPISGDWNGDGIDTVGLYNLATGTYYLTNTHTAGPADEIVRYGPKGEGWMPLMGKWGLNSTTQSSTESTSLVTNAISTTETDSSGLLSVSADSSESVNPNDPLLTDAGTLTNQGSAPGRLTTTTDDSELIVTDSTVTENDLESEIDPVLNLALMELADELLI